MIAQSPAGSCSVSALCAHDTTGLQDTALKLRQKHVAEQKKKLLYYPWVDCRAFKM